MWMWTTESQHVCLRVRVRVKNYKITGRTLQGLCLSCSLLLVYKITEADCGFCRAYSVRMSAPVCVGVCLLDSGRNSISDIKI